MPHHDLDMHQRQLRASRSLFERLINDRRLPHHRCQWPIWNGSSVSPVSDRHPANGTVEEIGHMRDFAPMQAHRGCVGDGRCPGFPDERRGRLAGR
jgi:hypothetical protein